MKRMIVAALVLALAACGPRASDGGGDKMADMEAARSAGEYAIAEPAASAPESAPMAPAAADGAPPADAATAPAPNQQGSPPGNVLLAYAYVYGVEVPAPEVQKVMKLHEKLCADAGANTCQVLGASTNTYGEDDVRGRLELRAEPRWLATYRERLEGDAEKAGGKLKSKQVSTEDLTRQITDTEARLRAQKTLRDRLQALLAGRPGKLAELLEVERELARVQGDIDAIESNLAVMKARVAMSLLTIDYASSGASVTDTTFEPIVDALRQFLRTVSEGLAALILITAALLPWIAVIGVIAWLVLRWRRKRREARDAREAATPTPGL